MILKLNKSSKNVKQHLPYFIVLLIVYTRYKYKRTVHRNNHNIHLNKAHNL